MKKSLFLHVVVIVFGLAAAVRADFRPYAWTYQFMTMTPGFIEIEIYNTYVEPEKAGYSGAYWKRQLELETGITDRIDFSFYLTDSRQSSTDPLNVTDIKLRTRIKLAGEKNNFVFDPLVYIEYRLQQDRRFPDTWEIKGIITKEIGGVNASLNLIAEERINYIAGWKKFVFGYSAGVSYLVAGTDFSFGLESTGEFTDNIYRLGPCAAYIGEHFWASAGAVFGLNNRSEYVMVQAVVGVAFDLNIMKEYKK